MSTILAQFNLLGESPAMRQLAHQAQIAARYNDTVLIIGERGTGKELLAHAIHRLSRHRGAKLITVDCAILQPTTAESTLFGHERGAFTGAQNQRIGLLEVANNNTLFIDEINKLPLELQPRFLRFLEERTIQRVGSTQVKPVQTRVIAASNSDLAAKTQRGEFLPDLYDRLNVLPIACPPLRQRGEDRLLLTCHFLGEELFQRLSSEAIEQLRRYSFPGNVRELYNLCRRIAVFYGSNFTEEEAGLFPGEAGAVTKRGIEALLSPSPFSCKKTGEWSTIGESI